MIGVALGLKARTAGMANDDSGNFDQQTILVTGGCGFIGSALVRHLIRDTPRSIVNIDKMTYAASEEALEEASSSARHRLIRADIADAARMAAIFAEHRPDAVVHLAAETHVDRAIDGPGAFIHSNVIGTYTMLEAARDYWSGLDAAAKRRFRFCHVSTDEVFGTLGPTDPPFDAATRYDPRSPYSASKAAADHLVRAWRHTYGLPTIVSNTSNNYGPWQFPEKLIPLILINALEGKPLPVYGDGAQMRDWLYVEDHAAALHRVLDAGEPGRTYCLGARQPRRNLDVVRLICAILDEARPDPAGARERLIAFVPDRPGHDFRYEIDPGDAESDLHWRAPHDFEAGLRKTVAWYLDHETWWRRIRAERYAGQRLGTAA
jgi:dTDP-glucose 4,6-dehydratase